MLNFCNLQTVKFSDFGLLSKIAITRYDLLPQFFFIDAMLLCEFESDKI